MEVSMRWIKATIAGLAAMTGTIASPRFARSRLRSKCLAIAGVLALTGVSVALPSTAFAAAAGGGASTLESAILNVNTGGCIDDSFTYGLRSFPCNNLSYQNWWVTPVYGLNGSFWFQLQNENTGGCIDDSFTYHLRSFA